MSCYSMGIHMHARACIWASRNDSCKLSSVLWGSRWRWWGCLDPSDNGYRDNLRCEASLWTCVHTHKLCSSCINNHTKRMRNSGDPSWAPAPRALGSASTWCPASPWPILASRILWSRDRDDQSDIRWNLILANACDTKLTTRFLYRTSYRKPYVTEPVWCYVIMLHAMTWHVVIIWYGAPWSTSTCTHAFWSDMHNMVCSM